VAKVVAVVGAIQIDILPDRPWKELAALLPTPPPNVLRTAMDRISATSPANAWRWDSGIK